MLLLLELLLSATIVPLALIVPNLGNRVFASIEHHVAGIASRRRLGVLTILILALGARLAVLPVEPIPRPETHDEFSYLLMADTFAHGRLTNPSHPLWEHFETFHVNQVPTYCSKFFPAQGLFLALGQVMFREPFWGVWLSTGLMCAAMCWALQAWMPPTWAFLAGVLVTLRLGVFRYWADSYWGGSVAAIGGALVLGAYPRIRRRRGVRDSLLMTVGLILLANSRPYEGLVYSVPILVSLGIWIVGERRQTRRPRLGVILVPAGIALTVAVITMGYYFWRTTGSPIRPPYAVYSARYDAVPFVPWKTIGSIPVYRHPEMQRFYLRYVMNQYVASRSTPVFTGMMRGVEFWSFFIGPALTLSWLVALWLLPYGTGLGSLTRKTRFLVLINAASFIALLVPIYFNLHYAAPMACAFYALQLFSLRKVWMWKRGNGATGKFIVRGMVLVCLIVFVVRILMPTTGDWQPFNGKFATKKQIARTTVLKQLQESTGQQLVIVRYLQSHNPEDEWIYNQANIDASHVVWARDMGARNSEVIQYFRDRRVWLLEPDYNPPRLTPYSGE